MSKQLRVTVDSFLLVGVSSRLILCLLCLTTTLSFSAYTYELGVPIADSNAPVKVAFITDAHFQDIFGDFELESFKGLPTKTQRGVQHATIRSMAAQLKSTRLYNESYFALIATLNDLVQRNIKLVALPGDFTDDGQAVHVKGLATLLRHYTQTHGLEFFVIPGNHDPIRPFSVEGGKSDFLAGDGSQLSIYSAQHPKCLTENVTNIHCTNAIKPWGYPEIMAALSEFGLSPQPHYRHYETPFSFFQIDPIAAVESRPRQFEICESANHCLTVPDASYLVEPIDGLWLLAIDSNVYVPRAKNDPKADYDPFKGSSNAGYNALLRYKPQLVGWISDVVKRARIYNKNLIAFSHFPIAGFNDDADLEMAALFRADALQQRRSPTLQTSQALADTGLKLHIAGHMHINDTQVVRGRHGNTLFNIQAPSLVGYKPGYKLLTIQSPSIYEFETITLEQIDHFDQLFQHYEKEFNTLSEQNRWNSEILEARNYSELTEWHLKELVRLRFLPKDWPAPLVNYLTHSTSDDIRGLMQQCGYFDAPPLTKEMGAIDGLEIANDFYRLRNADHLFDLPSHRRAIYQSLDNFTLTDSVCDRDSKYHTITVQLSNLFKIINKSMLSQPSDHFQIDLEHDRLKALKRQR
ncbi:metallophosphoesterase family protein [Echinimonas agarilytica]|uniref:Metallophosphoesterase n=1 Tax=Echinimonas agarilytica TaxID=1215918 RepID=A0AA41W801_9GAMM|nr:metallophosphoesterase [Echinimonas agarilytica]MCM2680338.1 metallophosphoesterase [Echinimonas agarilytica]